MKPQATPPQETTRPYIFNARELARLAIYRAAIVAGFYTDECETSSAPISPIVAQLVAVR